MRIFSTFQPFLALLLGTVFLSCDRDLVAPELEPDVSYILLLSDSLSKKPVGGAKVRVTTLSGDTVSGVTDPVEGRLELKTLASSKSWFVVTRSGYRTLDFIDTVKEKPDTVFHQPLRRLLQVKLVPLAFAVDSNSPTLVSGPKKGLPGRDTVMETDTLEFQFSQPVETIHAIRVSRINEAELLVRTRWNATQTKLQIWPKEGTWEAGKAYGYSLALQNERGVRFTIPEDSIAVVEGTFWVRGENVGQDSGMANAHQIRFATFHSGAYYGFQASDTNSSPYADSTSEFARLKWNWDAQGKHPDSLVIYFQDNQSIANWVRWDAVPGFLDSMNLVFSDRYSTLLSPSQKPRFPLRDSGGTLFFRVIPKRAGSLVDAQDTILEPMTQGMGPTVYAFYNASGARDSAGTKDSVQVTFRREWNNPASTVEWGENPPKVEVFDEAGVANTLTWSWDSDHKTGYLIYSLPNVISRAPRLRVHVNGQLFGGKPIWQRNVHDVLVVE